MKNRYNYWISYKGMREWGSSFSSATWVSIDGHPISSKEDIKEVEEALALVASPDTGIKVTSILIQCINFLGVETIKDDEDSAEDETTG